MDNCIKDSAKTLVHNHIKDFRTAEQYAADFGIHIDSVRAHKTIEREFIFDVGDLNQRVDKHTTMIARDAHFDDHKQLFARLHSLATLQGWNDSEIVQDGDIAIQDTPVIDPMPERGQRPDDMKIDPHMIRAASDSNITDAVPAAWVYFMARHIDTTRHQGRGMVSTDEIKALILEMTDYSEASAYRYFASGDGIFWTWNKDYGRLRLHKLERVVTALTSAAIDHIRATDIDRVYTYLGTNAAGHNAMLWVSMRITSKKSAILARAMCAWKNHATIAQDTAAHVWGVSKRHIIRWDKLEEIGTTANYAEYIDTPDRQAKIDTPSHALKTGENRYFWQLPNTYHHDSYEHAHKGRSRKVRTAHNAALSAAGFNPDAYCAVGQAKPDKHYFCGNEADVQANYTAIDKHTRKAQTSPFKPRYVRLGMAYRGHFGLWECTNDNVQRVALDHWRVSAEGTITA